MGAYNRCLVRCHEKASVIGGLVGEEVGRKRSYSISSCII